MTTRSKKPSAPPVKQGMKISETVLARARRPLHAFDPALIFKPAQPTPGVVPAGERGMAFDEVLAPSVEWASAWAAGAFFGSAYAEGQAFMGYPELAYLAQRPEYRQICETIAVEMTRKWVEFVAKGDEDKSARIGKIEEAFERLDVRGAFRKVAEQDGFFGRAHLFIDLGVTDNPDELTKPIGDGTEANRAKVKKGSLLALRPVEAVWAYPTAYNSNDPLRGAWYRPEAWFVMGKRVHASRFMTFIGREVPDLLKPAYSFGGLALSQMAKPYVDNWLRTRQSVSDIISAFSVFVLATDMAVNLQDQGQELFKRADLFNLLRDNRGVMMIDKAKEEFSNVAASLAGLDQLQAQAQEHMAAVSRIPTVKLLGIQPAGLNADSEGVMRAFYDSILAFQEQFFTRHLTTVLRLVQLSEFGDVDESITFKYVPLWSLSEKEEAEVRKMDAETDVILVDGNVISPLEARTRLAGDEGSAYAGLDIEDVPERIDEGAEDPVEGTEPRVRVASSQDVA